MNDEIYEELAEALNRLPNAFPRTESNVEIPLLKKIFSQEEASLAIQLSGHMEPVELIAERVGQPAREARLKLLKMARRGLVWFSSQDGKPHFRLAAFMFGIYEAQLENMDHELAHLVENYMASGGAEGIMKPQPAIHRVVPAQGVVKSERILPYEDVKAILLAARTFNVRDCICRVQQDQMARRCSFPLKVCLYFFSDERAPGPETISREEALAVLDQSEEVGLVHLVSNIMKGMFYICNCCGCCCGILRGINELGIENSVAQANYFAVIDPVECQGCGRCIERCQVHAISEPDGVAVVDRQRCIGCGLCATGCPNDAVGLNRKQDSEILHPPEDYAAWEKERLKNRGLLGDEC